MEVSFLPNTGHLLLSSSLAIVLIINIILKLTNAQKGCKACGSTFFLGCLSQFLYIGVYNMTTQANFLWVSIHKTELNKTLIMDLAVIHLNGNICIRSVAVSTYMRVYLISLLEDTRII